MKVQHQFRWKAISKICTARKKKKQNKTKQIHNYTYTYIYTYIKIKRYIFHLHFHMYMKYIENYTWAHVDMEFLFECLTRDVEFNTRREIPLSTCNHVLFCLSYKHNSPLLRRKAGFINE